ncbi:MAG: metallophosphoesterase family protein [Candidatus Aminicenantes bacterium]|nr:metallophosphoesterase family protein [Candidatus Aminicenantes bacterium]
MKIKVRSVLASLLLLLALSMTGRAVGTEPRPVAFSGESPKFKDRNIDLVGRFLTEASSSGNRLDDYYFVLIGDIQNSPKDFGHAVFNAIAKDMLQVVDEKTGERLYDRIRFVILNGDLVYEGSSPRQWDALEKAFDGKGPDGISYPYLQILTREKPIFPVTGNHELLSFRPHAPTHYTDLMDSTKGPVYLKSFFDWDRWIHNPHILYPVPADLPGKTFRELSAKLGDPADVRYLAEQYVLKKDGRFHLKFNENPPLQEDEYRAGKERLAAGLAAIFRKAGYGTLPVLNSDNMVHYAFEARNVVYLLLDSMARGWHYPDFARLKQALYPDKKEQHRLNLFTVSPFNGQSDFYQAVAAYARERGLTLVVSMHSPIFNSSRHVTNPGVGYNSWLALGLPQPGQEKGAPSFFDDILFSDASDVFSSCVHAYEHFTLIARAPGSADHTVQCYISGGGGGPLRTVFMAQKTKPWVNAYNQKLQDLGGPRSGRSVEIRDDVTGVGHHYLLVHVVGGRVVDASPHFVNPEDFRQPKVKPQVTLSASYLSHPSSTGASLEFCPGVWGREKGNGYLAFVNWRPSLSLGVIDYNIRGISPDAQAYAGTLEVSPFTLEFHLPKANLASLKLLGFKLWDGRANLRRAFLTTGVEMPLFYDLFGRLERLNVGVEVYFPFQAAADANQDFGRRTRLALYAGYRFRL